MMPALDAIAQLADGLREAVIDMDAHTVSALTFHRVCQARQELEAALDSFEQAVLAGASKHWLPNQRRPDTTD